MIPEQQETELSKGLGHWLKHAALPTVGICSGAMLAVALFGWGLGACYIDNSFRLKRAELDAQTAPVGSNQ